MENQKQKKPVGAIALVVLLLIVTIVSLVLATYAWAKYTTSQTGNAQAQVAAWNVSFEEDKDSIYGTNSHVSANRIAPGTSGSFDVTVVPSTTEVCFDYEIIIDSFGFVLTDSNGQNATDVTGTLVDSVTVDQLKSHISFYYMNGQNKVYMTPGTTKITDTYDIGSHNGTETATNPATKTIYWEWVYEDAALRNAVTAAEAALATAQAGNDAAAISAAETALATAKADLAAYDVIDTAAGKYADAQSKANPAKFFKLKINYSMKATQVEPNGSHGPVTSIGNGN